LSKYTFDEFQDRVRLSERMYCSLEDRMEDFLDYVPLDQAHLNVYSLELVSIILETGPEILSSFDLIVFPNQTRFIDHFTEARKKLLEKEKSLRKNQSLTFTDYSSFLNKSMSLNTKTIEIVGLNAYTLPFKEDYPEWWNVYNKLKHDKYSNLKKATLKNALKALGALCLLKDYYVEGVPAMDDRLGSSLFGYVYDVETIRDQLIEI
jgi:hypothetical protein